MRTVMSLSLFAALTCGANDFVYVLDDGDPEALFGTGDARYLVGNVFEASPGHERIVGIEFGNGPMPEPFTLTALLYEDPTDDDDPSDAVLLAQAPITTGDGFDFDQTSFPSVNVSGAFFAGVLVEFPEPTIPKVSVDASISGFSWFASGDVDVGDLGASGIQPLQSPFTFFIRVLAGPACVGDFDSSGVLDILDFIAFQQAFQAGEACADVNGDGDFDILDFVAFQQAFHAGC